MALGSTPKTRYSQEQEKYSQRAKRYWGFEEARPARMLFRDEDGMPVALANALADTFFCVMSFFNCNAKTTFFILSIIA